VRATSCKRQRRFFTVSLPPGGVAVAQLGYRHTKPCRKQGGIKCGKAGEKKKVNHTKCIEFSHKDFYYAGKREPLV